MKNKENATPFKSEPERLKRLNPGEYSWSRLPEFYKRNIETGLKDIENGHVMSSEEFWRRLKMD